MNPRAGPTRRNPLVAALAALAVTVVPLSAAAARETLGVFSGWGAFRDADAGRRCFAITEPVRRGGDGWRAFVGIGFWPERGVRGQLNIRLSRRKLRGTPVMLVVGERRFALVAGGSDAWARNAARDAAIVAALRSGTSLSVEATANTGRAFADTYALRGAATAIDAAALGCARRQ